MALITLTAQIFSIPKDSNLLPTNPWLFTLSTMLLIVVFLAIHTVLLRWEAWWEFLRRRIQGVLSAGEANPEIELSNVAEIA